MRLFLALVTSMIFTGCTYEGLGLKVEDTPESDVKETVIIQEEEIVRNFEDYYFLTNSSSIELLHNGDNRVTILRDDQYLLGENKDNSISQHPDVYLEDIKLNGREFNINKDVNYNSTWNIKQDSDDSVISGVRYSKYTFKMLNNCNLKLTIKIYDTRLSSGPSSVVTSETWTSTHPGENCKEV